MEDVEKILLNAPETRLLKYIQKHQMWNQDERVQTQEFKRLEFYRMLEDYTDERFPILYSDGIPIPEPNAYRTVFEVEHYFRYQKEKRKAERKGFRRDLILGIIGCLAGGIVTLATEHFSEIVSFIQEITQHH